MSIKNQKVVQDVKAVGHLEVEEVLGQVIEYLRDCYCNYLVFIIYL